MGRRANDTSKRDELCLSERRAGLTCRAIGIKHGICTQEVYRGIERARLKEKPAGAEPTRPTLLPLYPVPPLTPGLRPGIDCPHRGPLKRGSSFYCEVCGKSGMDHMPIFRPHPTDTKRDSKPPQAKAAKQRTRKQRRAKIMAQPSAN